MDIIPKSLGYLIVTNPYIIPLAPMLFGQVPGDQYYALTKNLFFFIGVFVITMIIWHTHNSKSNNPQHKELQTTFKDSTTVMFIVLLAYFLVSILFPATQLIKIQFEEIFNSIFFVLAFAIVGFAYSMISENISFIKTGGGNIRNIVFSSGILILFILYTLFDAQISGTIPGINFIPLQIRKMLNIAIKLNNARAGDPYFINSLTNELTSTGQVSHDEVGKLINVAFVALSSIPEKGLMLLDKIKDNSTVLDKLLGPVDLTDLDMLIDYIGHPFVKMFLNLIP